MIGLRKRNVDNRIIETIEIIEIEIIIFLGYMF